MRYALRKSYFPELPVNKGLVGVDLGVLAIIELFASIERRRNCIESPFPLPHATLRSTKESRSLRGFLLVGFIRLSVVLSSRKVIIKSLPFNQVSMQSVVSFSNSLSWNSRVFIIVYRFVKVFSTIKECVEVDLKNVSWRGVRES